MFHPPPLPMRKLPGLYLLLQGWLMFLWEQQPERRGPWGLSRQRNAAIPAGGRHSAQRTRSLLDCVGLLMDPAAGSLGWINQHTWHPAG